MKITRIEVSNVAGLARAEINMPTGALLVAGPNMSGKSSLRDAISMALTGQLARVTKKNQLGQMLHDGAKKGRAAVFGGAEVLGQYLLPKGEFTAPEIAGAEYLPLLIDPAKFANMPSDERRSTLFKITGCRANTETMEPLLDKRGVDMERFKEVQPMLRSGFPAAEKYAQEKAREGKGAWKAVTGEQWSSEKAEGWEPERITTQKADPTEIDAAWSALNALEDDLEQALQSLGESKAKRQAADQQADKIKSLRETAGLLERRTAKHAEDVARAKEWEKKLEIARKSLAAAKAMPCPCCSAALIVHDGALIEFDAANVDDDAMGRVDEYAGYVASAKRAAANSERDIKESKDAAEMADALAPSKDVPSEQAITNAEATINELRQQRDYAKAKVSALEEAAGAEEARKKTIENAAFWHADITAWLVIAEAMAPTGIPADLLQQALSPINQSLAHLSSMAGWPLVEVTSDIEVTSKGRAYALCSESEQWRADTLIAFAIAQLTGLRVAVLDRFDVLEPKARGQIIGLVRELIRMDCMDTIVMLGTLKEKPASLPEEFTGAWISNCIVEA